MPAAAAKARANVATRPATRRAPARRPAPRPKRRQRPAPAPARQPVGLIPNAVNRVGDLADSGLVVRLTRSRAWIGVLAALLGGIVFLNVLSLSYTSSSGQVASRSEALERENALLRAKLTEDLSGPRVERVALANGLLAPEAHEIEYLSAGDQYAQVAARRIRDGLLTTSAGAPVPEVAPVAPEVVAPVAPEVPAAAAPPPAPVPTTP